MAETEDPREPEASEEYQRYDRIIPSQLQPGSKIKVETLNTTYEFEMGADGLAQLIYLRYSKEREGVPVGLKCKVMAGGFIENASLVLRRIDGGLFATSVVEELQGSKIFPDENTPKMREILRNYFPHIEGNFMEILGKLLQQTDATVSAAGESWADGRAPGTFEMSANPIHILYLKVSALLIELVQIANSNRFDLKLTADQFEDILQTLKIFFHDFSRDTYEGSCIQQKANFLFIEGKKKKEFEVTAQAHGYDGRIFHFNFEKKESVTAAVEYIGSLIKKIRRRLSKSTRK